MSFFENLFSRGKKEPIRIEHPIFGTMTYSKHDGWINNAFTFHGFHPVELLMDGGPEGPTDQQVDSFRRFEQLFAEILKQAPELLNRIRRDSGLEDGTFVLTGITMTGTLWTIWFDCVGDDHYWYGIQSDDEWKTLYPFADD